jgi:hypothetical protein
MAVCGAKTTHTRRVFLPDHRRNGRTLHAE